MAWLPDQLAPTPRVIWRQALTGEALAGIAATSDRLIVADRDATDHDDLFRCLRLEDGAELWKLQFPAPGRLDYGNAPRATPLIVDDLVFLYNAFGILHGVELATGKVVWRKDLWKEHQGRDKRNSWGASSSPLLVNGRLIVNPGGPLASIIGLAPRTGELLWATPGAHAGFGSFVVAELGGRRQIVGYDDRALCGFDAEQGTLIWRLVPPVQGDFNVPTPIVVKDRLLVSTENNGTRLYGFDAQGKILAQPLAVNEELAPDTHTPIVIGDRVLGVWNGLHCLDLQHNLTSLWYQQDDAFDDYAVLVGSDTRAMVISKSGELILFDPQATPFTAISRLSIFERDSGVYAHPAFIGSRMILRGSREIVCLDLSIPTPDDDDEAAATEAN